MVQAAHQVASPRHSGERQPPPNPRSSKGLTEETASGLSLEEQVGLSIERQEENTTVRGEARKCAWWTSWWEPVSPAVGGTHHAQSGEGTKNYTISSDLFFIYN